LEERIANLREMKRKAEEKAAKANAEIESMMGQQFDQKVLLKAHKNP